jgi:hypothetical protein
VRACEEQGSTLVPGIGPGMAPSPMEQDANQLHCIGGLQHYRFCLGCAFRLRSLLSSPLLWSTSIHLPLFASLGFFFACLWSSPVGKAEGDEREGVPGSHPARRPRASLSPFRMPRDAAPRQRQAIVPSRLPRRHPRYAIFTLVLARVVIC